MKNKTIKIFRVGVTILFIMMAFAPTISANSPPTSDPTTQPINPNQDRIDRIHRRLADLEQMENQLYKERDDEEFHWWDRWSDKWQYYEQQLQFIQNQIDWLNNQLYKLENPPTTQPATQPIK